MFATGAATGWPSPTVPQLEANNEITADEGSWVVAFMIFGYLFGPIPMKLLVDRFGRKVTMLASSIPLLIGWAFILIGLYTSVYLLYVARIFHGIGTGMAYCVCAIYLGEIASDGIRGSLGTLITVMTKAGILMAYSIGPYVAVNIFPYILIIPILIFIGSFIWLPDSPYYLVAKKNDEAATKSLQWLRGRKNVTEEFQQIEIAVKKAQENEGTFKELFSNGNKRALIIAIGLVSCQQLCGSQAILGYSQSIFQEIGGDFGASETAIIMGVVQLIAAIFSSSVVDRLGRRPLMLVSTAGAAISLLIVGTFFFVKSRDVDVSTISWLPITAIMVFITTFTLGIATVPFAMMGEIFPTNVKALAAALCTMVAAVVGFVVTKLYQVVSTEIGIYYSFWGFSFFSFLFVGFIWFLVPETKQKSLDVILEELNSPWKSRKNRKNLK